ncbi:hypothetical protein AB0I60_10390 [Actinosynnema sp. NPDC050436]|uniref:hypothetical protein n=1 Tax=Actinosynnema sp. NPDC050436 TaxID=3155659 RepID=UPI0033E4278B
MGRVKNAVVGGTVVLIVLSGALALSPAVAGEVAGQHYSCGSSGPPDADRRPLVRATAELRLLSGPSPSCRPGSIVRVGDLMNYHCYTVGGDGRSWTYLSVPDRNIRGWARDDLLPDNGSFVNC